MPGNDIPTSEDRFTAPNNRSYSSRSSPIEIAVMVLVLGILALYWAMAIH
jgi:hypothetical protein